MRMSCIRRRISGRQLTPMWTKSWKLNLRWGQGPRWTIWGCPIHRRCMGISRVSFWLCSRRRGGTTSVNLTNSKAPKASHTKASNWATVRVRVVSRSLSRQAHQSLGRISPTITIGPFCRRLNWWIIILMAQTAKLANRWSIRINLILVTEEATSQRWHTAAALPWAIRRRCGRRAVRILGGISRFEVVARIPCSLMSIRSNTPAAPTTTTLQLKAMVLICLIRALPRKTLLALGLDEMRIWGKIREEKPMRKEFVENRWIIITCRWILFARWENDMKDGSKDLEKGQSLFLFIYNYYVENWRLL